MAEVIKTGKNKSYDRKNQTKTKLCNFFKSSFRDTSLDKFKSKTTIILKINL